MDDDYFVVGVTQNVCELPREVYLRRGSEEVSDDGSLVVTGSEVGETLVLYEVEKGIARITLNRPEARNALSFALLRELRTTLIRVKQDPAARVVVLQGAGDRAFCSGADLRDMDNESAGVLVQHENRGLFASLFPLMWDLGKPTIASVQGWALAGGFGLALSCDVVIASDRAKFGAPEINVGLWPHIITVPLLRAMPPKKALELMMTGRLVDAAEAERIGFVNCVVNADELAATVTAFATSLAQKSSAILKLGRDSFYASLSMSPEEAITYHHAALAITADTRDAHEGMKAFVEKREAIWFDC
jgi:enoyl-CoA hydratase/carnithine racemase